ncbi:sugar porter family MFS transporter [Aestuariivivens sediminis]|uniref:sugar porter family MFS transporter n=1 Tax=Aestuariivivens sediminis TaxID=2913557 RepID=UPI001F55B55F|nr:sugar porter family MFS transporter [Aestuariivivens sediminis]
MSRTNKKTIFIAFVVSLGGFLFGFDAGIISGVMSYVGPEFDLNDIQNGWVVSSPTFSAMIAMLISGRLSDFLGRKRILIAVAFLYALSALLSAYAINYQMLWIARMIGGIAFGAALILAPAYIAEISSAENRGKLVSIQQLNIVLGFFAAFLCNYYLNKLNISGAEFLSNETVWRWMLGIEFIPALIYFIMLFFIPKSPRWLYLKSRISKAKQILTELHGSSKAKLEIEAIEEAIARDANRAKVKIWDLLKPGLRFIFFVGLTLGILQQITGINAIYFYATSIFKQTGIGTNAAFASGVFLSLTTVLFTVVAIFLIDRMGRRPLLLFGMAGIAISLIVCSYGFGKATYELSDEDIKGLPGIEQEKLTSVASVTFDNDVDFKNAMKEALGTKVYAKNEGAILEAATNMNAILVLIGILCFTACFAFSLGPVMWVMLSEVYPNKYRGLAIGIIGFVNSFCSWFVQQIFPLEISMLGNSTTFLIFGMIALLGFFVLVKILPETKGKSLEELESELTF